MNSFLYTLEKLHDDIFGRHECRHEGQFFGVSAGGEIWTRGQASTANSQNVDFKL
jgi:hypothetical protein